MKIVAGEKEVEILGVYGTTDRVNDIAVDALKISLQNDITEEQIVALLNNPWNLYSDSGDLLGVHVGCNQVKEYTVTFLKVSDATRLLAQLNTAANALASLRQQVDAQAAELEVLRQTVGG